MSVLTASAGLSDESSFTVGSFRDGLTEGYLWSTNVTFDLEFSLHTVDDDVQVKFAHTGDDSDRFLHRYKS